MKVLMFPAPDAKLSNLYIRIVTDALKDKNVEVVGWRPYQIFRKGDVFHAHWPEVIPFMQHHKWKKYLYPFIKWNFWTTLRRIKKNGGVIVWTVHNLHPHNVDKLDKQAWQDFISRFSENVDRYITLTDASQKEIEEIYPALKGKQRYVCHHPHYELVNKDGGHLRSQYGIREDEIVFALIGSLTKPKGADAVITEFVSRSPDNAVLFLAGKPDKDIATLIEEAREKGARIVTVPRFLTDEEVQDFHQIADITLFLSQSHLNSGTVFQSLSNNVPVRVHATDTNRYLASRIGREWVSLIEKGEPIISEELLSELKQRQESPARCDLSEFSPEIVADQHIKAYTADGKE